MNSKEFFKRTIILVILFFALDFIISLVLVRGLNKYYGFTAKPNILVNGSSMAMSGFNKKDIESITSMQVALYVQEGVTVVDRYEMINHFFRMYPMGVGIVIYEVNPVMFSNIKTAENVYTHFSPYLDDKAINKYIKERASIKEYYTSKIIRTKRFESRLMRLILMGYLGINDNVKTNIMDTTMLIPLMDKKGTVEVEMDRPALEIFENTMSLIKSHNCNIILVMMPMYYLKLQTYNISGYNQLCIYFKDFCVSEGNAKFIDLNQSSLIYNLEYFSDPLHFNAFGKKEISNIIGAQIIEIQVNQH